SKIWVVLFILLNNWTTSDKQLRECAQ
ncbi:hypothetical protein pipiens_000546, partial [Culex pipiens pipiens]